MFNADDLINMMNITIEKLTKSSYPKNIATLYKTYFNNLLAEGFTREEALKIVTCPPLVKLDSK